MIESIDTILISGDMIWIVMSCKIKISDKVGVKSALSRLDSFRRIYCFVYYTVVLCLCSIEESCSSKSSKNLVHDIMFIKI